MHFLWDVTLGQVVVAVPLFLILSALVRVLRVIINYRIEHDMLMVDWANRQIPPIKLVDLPTRSGGRLF